MLVTEEKRVKWLNTKLEKLEKLKTRIKDLTEQKDSLEAEILSRRDKIGDDATLETGMFKVTFSPTISYSLTEEGYNLIMEKEGLDSIYFKHSPDSVVVRRSPYANYLEAKEGKMKVMVKLQA